MNKKHHFLNFANFLSPANRAKIVREERGSALIVSMLLTIIVLAAVTAIIMLTLTSVKKAVFASEYLYYGNAATSAVNNALVTANSSGGLAKLDAARSYATGVKGKYMDSSSSSATTQGYSDQPVNWIWYAKKTGNVDTQEYTIYATGYRESPTDTTARGLIAVIRSIKVASGTYASGTNMIDYTVDPYNITQWGMYGRDSVTLRSGAVVNSYDSEVELDPDYYTHQGTIASNGPITLGDPVPVDRINELSITDTTPTRCVGSICDYTDKRQLDYTTSFNSVNSKMVAAKCNGAASSYTSFTSSTSGTVIPANTCFNNITINRNTTVASSATIAAPANIYFKGTLTITAGVSFNSKKSPQIARFFTDTGTSFTMMPGTVSAPTQFYGTVAGANLACNDNNQPASSSIFQRTGYIYGGLACKTLSYGGGSQLWFDEVLKDSAKDPTKSALDGTFTPATTEIWDLERIEDVV